MKVIFLKKKVLKRLIIVGVIVLFILLIILGVVCYKKIKGLNGNIEMTINTLDDLKISADGLKYRSKLTKEDFNIDAKNYKNRNQLPKVLSRISTGGGISDGRLDLFYETVNNKDKEYFISSEKQKDMQCFDKECNKAYYMAFDLFFESEEPESIYLTANSYVKHKENKGLENAIRVAFVVEGTTSSKEKEDIQNLSAGINAIIWEPNSDSHTKEAINTTKDVYGEDINDNKLYYRGINSEFNDINIKDIKTSNNFSNISSNIVTKTDFNEDQNLFTIQQGTTKVRVYIWLESRDYDAMFKTRATNLEINLEFKKG